MKNTKILFFTILIIIIFIVSYYIIKIDNNDHKTNDIDTSKLELFLSEDRNEITIYKDSVIYYEINIDSFNNWSSKNWDSYFDQAPSFGEIRSVDFSNFYSFNFASISPDNSTLIISVSDYAAATDISLFVLVDLKSFEKKYINNYSMGTVGDYSWHPEGAYLALSLDTARNYGDFLEVYNIKSLEKLLSLSGYDIVQVYQKSKEPYNLISAAEYMPTFSNLQWLNKNISFKAIDLMEEESYVPYVYDMDKNELSIINSN